MLDKIDIITDKTRRLVNQFLIDNWFSTDISIRGEIIDGTKMALMLLILLHIPIRFQE